VHQEQFVHRFKNINLRKVEKIISIPEEKKEKVLFKK